jgi:hypothetical protein
LLSKKELAAALSAGLQGLRERIANDSPSYLRELDDFQLEAVRLPRGC